MVTKKTESESSGRLLARLAAAYGIQTRYRDALGQVREPSQETLLKTLLALGAGVNTLTHIERPSRMGAEAELERAIRTREAELLSRPLEPVTVAWEGILPAVTLRLPAGSVGATARLTLTLEDGSVRRGDAVLGRQTLLGPGYSAFLLTAGQVRRALGGDRRGLPGDRDSLLDDRDRLSWGRHQLRVEVAGAEGTTWVIAAPRRCWDAGGLGGGAAGEGAAALDAAVVGAAAQRGAARGPGRGRVADPGQGGTIDAALAALAGKEWGVFAPVYALRSARDWGAGDLADLRALGRWTGTAGGPLVATLPLLASSFQTDSDPSPYRPVSRLFWNEFFLAPEETVEWGLCEARLPWRTGEWPRRRDALRATELVDYEGVMGLKRSALEALASCFFAGSDAERKRDFEDFLREKPHAADYAAFRAAGEADGSGGSARTREGAGWSEAERYHLYCQWQMERQLARFSGDGSPGLLFDLPLGVHPQGFDAHEWPGLFASGVSTGAPPDAFFAAGQHWCTPPLHPGADREKGYAYLSACLRTLMRHACVVRIDHMMSFHRLFWIPEGADPKDGAYVSYPAEELYALLSCESHRCRTAVIGEDLGTISPGVRAAMRRHGIARTSIYLGSLRPRARSLEADVPQGAVATLETHDMVPLAGFLHGDDIETRVETGQLDRGAARREAGARRRLVTRLAGWSNAPAGDPGVAAPAILAGSLAALARSAAKLILVNLEDLLLERRPQNVPGTGADRPNWRRKMRVALEELPGYEHLPRKDPPSKDPVRYNDSSR